MQRLCPECPESHYFCIPGVGCHPLLSRLLWSFGLKCKSERMHSPSDFLFGFLLRCLWKRREVVLEQTVIQARPDLCFTPTPMDAPLLAINQVRTKVNPQWKVPPPMMHHPPPHDVPPQLMHHPHWCATPLWKVPPLPLTCHPPLLTVVYGDGWCQRSTLAFGAKSLVSFFLLVVGRMFPFVTLRRCVRCCALHNNGNPH